jgi:putative nucleotidyltransferase with HDIG domain
LDASVLILIKSFKRGIKSAFIWIAALTLPILFSMLWDKTLTINELSELLLIIAPVVIVGLLGEKQRRYLGQLKTTYISTLRVLAAITDARDKYTQGHSERVARYAVQIAKRMNLPATETVYLEQASLLHDIGKIAVPDRVLHKKDPLHEDEWELIKRHPEYSKKILSNLTFLSQIMPIVINHHGRFDDKDKTQKCKEPGISLATRILTVADAFDAMTSDRPYRNRLSSRQALDELEKYSGTQFDPNVVKALEEAFGSRFEDYPIKEFKRI